MLYGTALQQIRDLRQNSEVLELNLQPLLAMTAEACHGHTCINANQSASQSASRSGILSEAAGSARSDRPTDRPTDTPSLSETLGDSVCLSRARMSPPDWETRSSQAYWRSMQKHQNTCSERAALARFLRRLWPCMCETVPWVDAWRSGYRAH